jgi:cation:H+ antiporter
VLGARGLVAGAVALAAALGVPDRVIGLSVVAIGTSLPELAAALVAALRREGDILLGNLIGSNIFNVLGILGTVALVRPLALATVPLLDLAALLGFSLLTWLFLWTGRRLGRREGVLLFALYLSYTVGLYS